MFQDKIKTNIVAEDIVYAYTYHNRNRIKEFEDLVRIQVQDVVPGNPKEGIMVTGTVCDTGERVTGFVVYRENNNFIETSDGLKYISYFIENDKIHKCLKKAKGNKYIKLILILNFRKEAEIAVDIFPDMLFSSEEDVGRFLPSIKYNKCELDINGVKMELNGEQKIFSNYIIYRNDKAYNSDIVKTEFFNMMLQKYKTKNAAKYKFQAVFSLKPSAYEYSVICKIN